ncbi:PREDICTED: uncharacterized protein LOC109488003 [Branchiostoma belcheri]|uniref:Uncharacterized protein LOC109488003 n=1 Tax=Branchiostoma belcheri TaxID=7741 RepID=A0A6P5A370_BRABE|nr:PREDICTED: uncharacterized protein LOC109488003 [Branchiostoma belcheri]
MAEERAGFGEVRTPSPSEMDVTGSNGQSFAADDTVSSWQTQKQPNSNGESGNGDQEEPSTYSGGPTVAKGGILTPSGDPENDNMTDASGDVSVAMVTRDEEDEPMEAVISEDDSSTEPRNGQNNEQAFPELDTSSAMQSEHNTDSNLEPEESSLDNFSHADVDITDGQDVASSEERETGRQSDNSNIPVVEPGGARDSSFEVIGEEEISRVRPVECFNSDMPTDMLGEYDSGIQQPVTPPTPLQDEDAPTPLQDEVMDTEELDEMLDSNSTGPSVDHDTQAPEVKVVEENASSAQDTDTHAISTEENYEEDLEEPAQPRADSPVPALGLVSYPDSEGEDNQSEKDVVTEDTETNKLQEEEGETSEERASPEKEDRIATEEPVETDASLPPDDHVTTDTDIPVAQEENETEEPVTSHYIAQEEKTDYVVEPDSQQNSEALPTILKAFASSDVPIEPDEEEVEESGTQDEADVHQDAERMETEEVVPNEEETGEQQTEHAEQTAELQEAETGNNEAESQENNKEEETERDEPEKVTEADSETAVVSKSPEKNEAEDGDWDIIDVTDEVKGEPDIITIDDDDEDAETKKVGTNKDEQAEAGVSTGKDFILKYEDVQKENPAMSLTELAAVLFKMWKELDDKEKQIYKDYYYSEKKVYEADSTSSPATEVKEEPVDEDSMEAFLKELQTEDDTDIQLDEAESSLQAIQNETEKELKLDEAESSLQAIQNKTEKELKC